MKKKTIKPIKAWAVVYKGTLMEGSIAIFLSKSEALVWKDWLHDIIPVLITPIISKKKKK